MTGTQNTRNTPFNRNQENSQDSYRSCWLSQSHVWWIDECCWRTERLVVRSELADERVQPERELGQREPAELEQSCERLFGSRVLGNRAKNLLSTYLNIFGFIVFIFLLIYNEPFNLFNKHIIHFSINFLIGKYGI